MFERRKYNKLPDSEKKIIDSVGLKPLSLEEKIRILWENIRNNTSVNRTIYIFLTLVIITILSIYFIYGEYLFRNWPWLRFSIVVSFLTCFFPYVIIYEYLERNPHVSREDTNLWSMTGVFVFFALPFEYFLIYPGTYRLGIISDDKVAGSILVLMIVHGSGFHIIGKRILKKHGAKK